MSLRWAGRQGLPCGWSPPASALSAGCPSPSGDPARRCAPQETPWLPGWGLPARRPSPGGSGGVILGSGIRAVAMGTSLLLLSDDGLRGDPCEEGGRWAQQGPAGSLLERFGRKEAEEAGKGRATSWEQNDANWGLITSEMDSSIIQEARGGSPGESALAAIPIPGRPRGPPSVRWLQGPWHTDGYIAKLGSAPCGLFGLSLPFLLYRNTPHWIKGLPHIQGDLVAVSHSICKGHFSKRGLHSRL